MTKAAKKGTKYTVVGRYVDTGEIDVSYMDVLSEDIHFETLRHWGQLTHDNNFEVLIVFPGELPPAVTPATLKQYVSKHFPE